MGEEDDEDEDTDERQLLGEFEKELEGILLPSDREQLRSEVKAGMERELENIIQEVSVVLAPEVLQLPLLPDRTRTKAVPSATQGTNTVVTYLI